MTTQPSIRATDSGIETTYYASSRGVHAQLTIFPRAGKGYKMYDAKVHFEGPHDYAGEVDITRTVGNQGSMKSLCALLRETSDGICKLLDPHPNKPELVMRGVNACIAQLEKQTKDLYNEPPF